jgi:hypothetical protein
MTPEELYRQSLKDLPTILGVLGRKNRLSPEEVEDLRSDIHLKLLEDDHRRTFLACGCGDSVSEVLR